MSNTVLPGHCQLCDQNRNNVYFLRPPHSNTLVVCSVCTTDFRKWNEEYTFRNNPSEKKPYDWADESDESWVGWRRTVKNKRWWKK